MKFRPFKTPELKLSMFSLLCICFQIIFLSHAGAVDSVIFRHGRLSLGIKEMPLEQVLRKISQKTDVEIVFYDALNLPVSMAFENLTLEKGLKKLLFDCNFSFQYQKAVHDGKEEIVLTKVVAFSKYATDFSLEPGDMRHKPLQPIVGTEISPAATPSEQPKIPLPPTMPGEKPRIGPGVFLKVDNEDILTLSQIDITQDIQSRTASLKIGLAGGPDLREADKNPQKMEGLEITHISPGSILNKLGLKPGDVVQDINGNPTISPDQMAKALQTGISDTGGGTIRIEVERGNMIEPIYVEIGSPAQ